MTIAQARSRGARAGRAAVVLLLVLGASVPAIAQPTDTVVLRGHPQTVYLYGTRGGVPVVVTSGDGGWIHLGPQVAQLLASRGYFVVGVDAKAYLQSFTSGDKTLTPPDVIGDYRALVEFAARGGSARPVLVGVSEGAGLSLLAATDAGLKPLVKGVVGLGLGDQNELGWRWRDSVIYLTHGLPNEPMFSAIALAGQVAPLPLAAIHSTRDEYVPLAEVQRVLAAANEPKRLWVVPAADHRFSDNQAEFSTRLMEALAWIDGQGR